MTSTGSSSSLPPLPKPLASGPAGSYTTETLQAMAIAQDKYRKAYKQAKERALPGAIELLKRAQTVRPSTLLAETDVLIPTYNPPPVRFLEGEGAWLLGTDGGVYLDFLSGIAVTSLGHNHPNVTQAIVNQAKQLMHVSNLFGTEPHLKVAAMLQELSGWPDAKTFFCNSGAEANEGALKIAKKFGSQRNPNKHHVVSLTGAFHGRTHGTLRVTANPKYSDPFEPLGDWHTMVDRDDPEALKAAVNDNTCAIIIETIQGEAGVQRVPRATIQQARKLCDRHDALLIIDEIQTGIGRTGRWFSWQHFDVIPDIMTLAKGLGNGLPIGAIVANERAANVLQPGDHGTTFGGNPVACAGALAVLTTIRDDQLLGQCRDRGKLLKKQITQQNLPGVQEIRGKGLLLAVELDVPIANDVVRTALHNNLIINAPTPTTIRLAPPFIVSKKEVKEGAIRLGASIMAAHEAHLAAKNQ